MCYEYKDEDTRIPIKMMGIYSRNREEWIITALACWRISAAEVALYDTLGKQALEHILKQTRMSSIVVEGQKVGNLYELINKGNAEYLKNIIVLDPIEEELKAQIGELGIKVYSFGDILNIGEKAINMEAIPPEPETVASLLYTSGTTGDPKGVILTHRNCVAQVNNIISTGYFMGFYDNKDSFLSYLPLSHLYEKGVFMAIFALGIKVGFYHGDMLKFTEDAAELRVSLYTAVPRIYNRFYNVIQGKIGETKGFKRKLIERGIKVKLENMAKNNKVTHTIYDLLIFSKFKKVLGGKVNLLVSAAAPVSGDIMGYLKVIMSAKMLEGYGISECGAICISKIDDSEGNNVGPVMCSVEGKLVDIPEMNYFHTDVIDGKLAPRGEICFRGPCVYNGYFRAPDLTREVLEPDGWYHTGNIYIYVYMSVRVLGDVGQFISRGRLKIIDRKKNIFKLAQAEYVAPDKIENVLSKCKYVSQIFVYGDSMQYYLVAILVPDPQAASTWAANNST